MIRLITMLASGIPAIIGALMVFLTRKAATAAGSIVAFLALVVVFIACQKAIFDSLLAALVVPGSVINWIGFFCPMNFSLCIGALVSSKICRAAYDLARTKLQFINNAS